jgi:diguanylate cyclase (GGDEF)-like protein
MALAAELEELRAQIKVLGQRLAEAERLADRDTLTPLLNRRAFMREVQRAIAVARRHKIPASVIYFDLDGFKSVNDRFGHAAGDAALIAVAQRLVDDVRESDVVGRLGGDEFAVLLLHADREGATLKAESLRASVVGAPVDFEGARFNIGLTYGVREIAGADSAEQALAEADAMMYLRKPPKR